MTYIDVHTECADLELDRLGRGFTNRDHFAFASMLFDDFLITQRDVHVDTRSLQPSGEVVVTETRDDRWGGEIRYGGATTGPKNPVKYAQYEFFRGGRHDFFRNVYNPDHTYVQAAAGFFSRGRTTPHPHGLID